MIASFPPEALPPSPSTAPRKNFRVLRADFGDGYSQRTPDGLNVQMEEWTMVWSNVTLAEKNVITNFIDSLQGVGAFYYTMPGESIQKVWSCDAITATPDGYNNFQLSATFKREYDIA